MIALFLLWVNNHPDIYTMCYYFIEKAKGIKSILRESFGIIEGASER
jgi:hypothetical protein